MPGTANVIIGDGLPPGYGVCGRCSVVMALDENGKLVSHTVRDRLIGTVCTGTGEDPWDYRGQ